MTSIINSSQKSPRKVTIVIVVPTLRGGGAERVVFILLNHISRDKFENVYLVVLDMSNAVYSEFPEFVTIIDLGCTRVRYAFLKLSRILWKIRPDIVFSTLNNLNLYLALIRTILPPAYFIGRESSIVSLANKHFGNASLRNYFCKILYPRLDKIVCQSNFMANDLRENFGISSSKICIIYNPVDLSKIIKHSSVQTKCLTFQKSRDLALIAIGRLSFEKGFDLLIESLSFLPDISIHLIIIGEGQLKNSLTEMVGRVASSNHLVEFIGFQPEPYQFLKEADFFVLSSRFEGLPNAALESLACGTPVIALPSPGGVMEVIVDGKNGYLAENISTRALATSIRRAYLIMKSKKSLPRSNLLPPVCNLDLVMSQYHDLFDASK